METSPFSPSSKTLRTLPLINLSQIQEEQNPEIPEDIVERNIEENQELNCQPIAGRTRSKSVDVRNQLLTSQLDQIDLVSPDIDTNHSSIFQDPKLSKQLVVRLKRLQFDNFNSETPIRREEFIMANLSYTDLINAIPHFDGNERDLESFIKSCDIYHRYLSEEQAGLFLAIAISKLRGEALTKLQPTSTIRSWDEFKTRLEERIRKPLSFEYAQEKLVRITQGKNESIESYGKRFKMALDRLNNSSRTLTVDENALRLLREANEKLAVRKFEQNISNFNIKIIVGAANKNTLEGAIAFAMEKEFSMRNSNPKVCNYCKKEGHFERECIAKNKRNNSSPNYYNKRQQNFSETRNRNEHFNKNNNPNYKKPQNTFDNKKGNDSQNKNVRFCHEEDTVNQSELFQEDTSKN